MQRTPPPSLRHVATHLAAAVSLLGLGASAAAQSYNFTPAPFSSSGWAGYTCAAPTDAECLDAAYQESVCGTENIAANLCDAAVQDAMSTEPTTGARIALREDGEYTWVDTLAAPSTSDDYDYGLGASYLAELGQYAAELRNPALGSWITWKDPAMAKRAAWEASGNRVASCEEMAYEGWWTYSKFEDEVARRGADARAIFDAARATNFPATAVRTREGDLVRIGASTAVVRGLPFPSEDIPKNAYFLFQKTAFDRYPIPDWAIPSEAGRQYYAGDWSWHLAMDDHFASWGMGTALDGMLEGELERQKRFVKLLDKRAKILEALIDESMARPPAISPLVFQPPFAIGFMPLTELDAYEVEQEVARLPRSALTTVISPAVSKVPDESVIFTGGYRGNMGRLYAIDHQISAELERAAALGCLDTSSTGVCDWSPRLLADLIGEAYVKQREEEYQRCLELTGDDFSDSSPLGNPDAFDLLNLDYRRSAGTVRTYLNLYEASLDSLEFTPQPGQPTTPAVGWWRSGARWLGNDAFGAGYSYNFGFGLLRAEEAGECVIDFKAAATASASAMVAGKSLSLLDSDTYGVTEGNNRFRVHSHTTLLGIYSVYQPVERAYTSAEPIQPWHTQKEWAASAMFWIGPVPVTGMIGVVGQAGIELEAAVTMDRKCHATPKLDITGGLKATPYVKASAFIGALIGARGLGAGLRTDLQLANIAAPLQVIAEIHGRGDDLAKLIAATTATVTVDLGLTIDSLGGSVSGVVETPIKNWSKTIFAWEGKRLVDEHSRRSWRLPVGRILPKLGS